VEAALQECRVRDSSERADDELRPAGSLRRLQGGVVLAAAEVDAPEREVQISAQKMEPRQLGDEPESFRRLLGRIELRVGLVEAVGKRRSAPARPILARQRAASSPAASLQAVS
jgi:hypothetical protein